MCPNPGSLVAEISQPNPPVSGQNGHYEKTQSKRHSIPDPREVSLKPGDAGKKLHLFQALRLSKIATSLGGSNDT